MRKLAVATWIASVLIGVAGISLGPLVVIWCFNTLFPILDIPYNLATWAAITILGGMVKLDYRLNRD